MDSVFCLIEQSEFAHDVLFQKQKSVSFTDTKTAMKPQWFLLERDGLNMYMKEIYHELHYWLMTSITFWQLSYAGKIPHALDVHMC